MEIGISHCFNQECYLNVWNETKEAYDQDAKQVPSLSKNRRHRQNTSAQNQVEHKNETSQQWVSIVVRHGHEVRYLETYSNHVEMYKFWQIVLDLPFSATKLDHTETDVLERRNNFVRLKHL